MEPVIVVTGRAVPLDRTDVDTDQIIPSDWLKRVERTGFGAGLFSEWRDDRDFVLNNPDYVGATILVAGHNFGTGSSREHAVWALMDFGFQAVVSSRFADIFRNNCTKQGLLPVQVSSEFDRALLAAVAAEPTLEITIDVARSTIEAPAAGLATTFPLDEFTRQRLLNGWDDIGLSLRHADAITAFEARRPAFMPSARDEGVPGMVTLRPMSEADVHGAVEAFDSGFLAMRSRYGLPVTGNSLQDERRRHNRTRHLLTTDPGGSWVADDDGVIVGMSQSFVREDYWMLSQLGTVPGRQGRGLGRELLRLALSHGDPRSPGTIQCSRDPKAMALYSSFGFALHPVVAGWGALRPGTVTRPVDVVRYEADQVTDEQLDVVAAIDRKVRKSCRTIDIVAMLAEEGNRLLLHGDQAYAVAKDERIVTLGARNEESAALVLRTMLAEAPERETIEVNWLTSAQQWAIRVLTQAGIELQPYGPVMVRGMDSPPSPYIPSGGFG